MLYLLLKSHAPHELGLEWDCVTPGAFRFLYARDSSAKHGGTKLARTMIFADSAPAMVEMIQRGQIKPANLGL